LVICLLNATAGFLLFSTKSSYNYKIHGLFRLKIGKIIFIFEASHLKPLKICADRSGEFVYYDLKIIYKRFESFSTKTVLFEHISLCAQSGITYKTSQFLL